MPSKKLPPEVAAFFEETGRRGGMAGTGESKVRGDRSYYVKLGKLAALKRKKKGRK